MTSVTRDVI